MSAFLVLLLPSSSLLLPLPPSCAILRSFTLSFPVPLFASSLVPRRCMSLAAILISRNLIPSNFLHYVEGVPFASSLLLSLPSFIPSFIRHYRSSNSSVSPLRLIMLMVSPVSRFTSVRFSSHFPLSTLPSFSPFPCSPIIIIPCFSFLSRFFTITLFC